MAKEYQARNPIADKLNRLIKTGLITKEKICVKCDVHFETLRNVFFKPKVSEGMLRALKFGEIIDDNDIIEYRRWWNERCSEQESA